MWFFILRIALGPVYEPIEVRVTGFESQAQCEGIRAQIQVIKDREGWQSIICQERKS